jgi:hypothetical protein
MKGDSVPEKKKKQKNEPAVGAAGEFPAMTLWKQYPGKDAIANVTMRRCQMELRRPPLQRRRRPN